MRSSKGRRRIVLQGLIGLAAAQLSLVYADAPATKWYDAIGINGYVQGSYVGNLSKSQPQTNQLRVYDTNANSFNLNQALLKVSKPVGDDNYGFTVKLLMGSDAKFIHSTGLGSTNADLPYDVEEAYLTVNVPKVKGLSVVGGKFVTSCGAEVIESPYNQMIAPGLLFFYGMPFTNTGLKANYTVNDKLSLMAGVINGWDSASDNNPGKTLIYQASATPLKALTASLQGSYGPDATNDNSSRRNHIDAVATFTGIDKLTLTGEYLWGQDSNVTRLGGGGVGDVVPAYPATDGPSTVRWSGAGVWAGYALSDLINPGARFEVFNDQGGANRLGSAVNQTAKDLAVNNKFVLTKNTFARLEFRHDWSNQAVYTRNDGSSVRNQNTISADWVVTF